MVDDYMACLNCQIRYTWTWAGFGAVITGSGKILHFADSIKIESLITTYYFV